MGYQKLGKWKILLINKKKEIRVVDDIFAGRALDAIIQALEMYGGNYPNVYRVEQYYYTPPLTVL